MGSAKMVLESGEHPGALKDMVCSPGGTTIEAVRVLEEKGFRSAVIEAITQCMEKSEQLSAPEAEQMGCHALRRKKGAPERSFFSGFLQASTHEGITFITFQ